ncbi:MAG TPA: hypothetical protein VMZ53_03800 [Kofleriaceae bacterium]|nr:hypothetical protein [Kofleriaceae bacterium]
MGAKKKPGQQGNQAPQDDEDDDAGSGGGLTDEARTEINTLVHAAINAQFSRKLPAAISSAMETVIAPLREQLANSNRGRAAEGDDDEGDDDQDQQPAARKKGKQPAARKDPEVENMRKQLAKLTEEREQERTQARNRERDTMLREQLEAAGVDKNRVRGAIAVLRDSMKYDDKAGEWIYSSKRDGYEEPLDVSTGVSEWAATDEGKSYLAPPSNAGQPRGGSGMRPGAPNGGAPRVQNGGRPAQDPKAAKAQAKVDAVKSLSTAIDSLAGGVIPLG